LLKKGRILGRRIKLLSPLKKLGAFHRKRRIMHMILLEKEVAKEDDEVGII